MSARPVTLEILAHADGFYPWFTGVRALEGGVLVVTADTGGVEGIRSRGVITPDDMQGVLESLDGFWRGNWHHGRFFSAMAAGEWAGAEGDADSVDIILQTAMWGVPVFG